MDQRAARPPSFFGIRTMEMLNPPHTVFRSETTGRPDQRLATVPVAYSLL